MACTARAQLPVPLPLSHLPVHSGRGCDGSAIEGKAQDTRRQLYIGVVNAVWVGDPLGFLRRGCFQPPCLAALPIRLLGGEDAVTIGEVAGVALHCGAALTDIPAAEVPRGLDSPALFTGSA